MCVPSVDVCHVWHLRCLAWVAILRLSVPNISSIHIVISKNEPNLVICMEPILFVCPTYCVKLSISQHNDYRRKNFIMFSQSLRMLCIIVMKTFHSYYCTHGTDNHDYQDDIFNATESWKPTLQWTWLKRNNILWWYDWQRM